MSFVGVAVGVGGLATLGGAAIGAGAAGSAADKQSAAAAYAADLQKQMFDKSTANAEPWRQAGISALYGPGGLYQGGAPKSEEELKRAFIQDRTKYYTNQMGTDQQPSWMTGKYGKSTDPATINYEASTDWDAWGKNSKEYQPTTGMQLDPSLTAKFSMSDFQADPGYDFRMKEGQKALERSASARGNLGGGAFDKALTRYGQDYASNEYGNAYNRFNNNQTNRFNKLSTLAGLGQTSSGMQSQLAQNYGNSAAETAMQGANAQGAAGIAGANAWSGGLQGLGGIGKTWMDYTMANKYLGTLGGGGGGGGMPAPGGGGFSYTSPNFGVFT